MSQILVVDDEVGIRELLYEILGEEGHQVRLAQNASEARQLRSRTRPDLVLLDIWMPDTDGITLLKEWAASGQLTMPVVMMSGHATIDTAVEAGQILTFIQGFRPDLLRAVRLFDVYAGTPVPSGKKSLTFALTYRADDRTLTDEEVHVVQGQVVEALRTRFGGQLRGQEG